jgi:hypothetical protein
MTEHLYSGTQGVKATPHHIHDDDGTVEGCPGCVPPGGTARRADVHDPEEYRDGSQDQSPPGRLPDNPAMRAAEAFLDDPDSGSQRGRPDMTPALIICPVCGTHHGDEKHACPGPKIICQDTRDTATEQERTP